MKKCVIVGRYRPGYSVPARRCVSAPRKKKERRRRKEFLLTGKREKRSVVSPKVFDVKHALRPREVVLFKLAVQACARRAKIRDASADLRAF